MSQKPTLTLNDLEDAQADVKLLGRVTRMIDSIEKSHGGTVKIQLYSPNGGWAGLSTAPDSDEDWGVDVRARALELLREARSNVARRLREKGFQVEV